MVDLLRYPLQLTGDGQLSTLDSSEDDYLAQELACLLRTEEGERDLVPEYGIADPTFIGIDPTEVQTKISMFGPPITIIEATDRPTASNAIQVILEWEPEEEPDDPEQYDDPDEAGEIEEDYDDEATEF